MPFLKYVLILAFLLLAPQIYIYRCYVQKTGWRRGVKRCFWLPTLFFVVSLVIYLFHPMRMGMPFTRVVFIVMFVLIFGGVSFTILSLLGRLVGWKSKGVRRVFDVLATLFCAFTVGVVIYSFTAGFRRLTVREVTVCSPQLPSAFDGYRIVQFSDLHVGSFTDGSSDVKHIVDLINAQKGNMIVFTGDLVNLEANELNAFEGELSQLKAPDGVFSILGNHDYGRYKRWKSESDKAANLMLLKYKERSFGWHLMLNSDTLIHRGDTCLALVGTEDYGKKPHYQYGDVHKALAGLPRGGKGYFKLLLTHDPTYWRMKILPETDIQLTLAGHTHGMQLEIGSFSPCQWLFKEWNGLYREGQQQLFVSTGVGALIPYRLGAWPEVVVLTLRRR
jgi:predicted MPP superfamily phosphohydrolase